MKKKSLTHKFLITKRPQITFWNLTFCLTKLGIGLDLDGKSVLYLLVMVVCTAEWLWYSVPKVVFLQAAEFSD